jgi:hypothetical protein
MQHFFGSLFQLFWRGLKSLLWQLTLAENYFYDGWKREYYKTNKEFDTDF